MGLRFSTEAEYQAFQATRSARLQSAPEGVPEPVAAPQKRRGRMNKTETRFAMEVLDLAKHNGEIVDYRFEAVKLRLADGAWFTCDFVAVTDAGRLLFWEVKGFWREAARVRIKVAAELYPFFVFASAQRIKGGGWKTERY